MNYGMKCAQTSTTRSRISWSQDETTLYLDGRPLVVENLKTFVKELLDIAEEIMATKLLFDVEHHIPEFDLNTIDDTSNHNSGYYFLQDETNGRKSSCLRMLTRLQQSEMWNKIVEVEGEVLKFRRSCVDQYLKDDGLFRELLVLLIMFTCGMSGRGTEMSSLRYMNTMDGDRNIYLEGGQFMIVTEYHKSMAMMDELKVDLTVCGV